MTIKRSANALWNGGLKDGKGTFSVPSGAFKDLAYSFTTRFEDSPGTNPEELIAAAHAACFSMAFSGQLAKDGMAPKEISTKANLTMEKLEAGFTVTKIHLDVTAKVTGGNEEAFQKSAKAAKEGCPISRLLKAEISLAATYMPV